MVVGAAVVGGAVVVAGADLVEDAEDDLVEDAEDDLVPPPFWEVAIATTTKPTAPPPPDDCLRLGFQDFPLVDLTDQVWEKDISPR